MKLQKILTLNGKHCIHMFQFFWAALLNVLNEEQKKLHVRKQGTLIQIHATLPLEPTLAVLSFFPNLLWSIKVHFLFSKILLQFNSQYITSSG